jgi:hypothetical protein
MNPNDDQAQANTPPPNPPQNPIVAQPQPQPQPSAPPAQQPNAFFATPAQAPQQPPAAPSSGKKKVLIIAAIAGGVLIVTAIIIGLLGSMGSGSSPLQGAINTTTGQASDVVPRSDGTLLVDSTINRTEAAKTQDISAGLNEQINLSDGFSFMVTGVEVVESFQRTLSGKAVTFRPDSGNEFISVAYVVGSRAEDITVSYSSTTFDVKNVASGEKYSAIQFLSSDVNLPKGYYSLKMEVLRESGTQQAFIVYYEVPKGSSLTTEREQEYQRSSSDEMIVIKGTVQLR